MGTRLRCLTAIALALATAGAVEAAVFSDTFDAAHDYVADGLAGTFWDGFIGMGPDETVDALNASIARPGQLYIESTEGRYQEPWIPLAPFLYKVIEGDFIATVQVTEYAGTEAAPVYHNNCGILVRATPDDAGAGEDWVALDYFPIWSCGNFVRTADDDVRFEDGHNGMGFDLDPYLQIERIGNVFHFRTSADGASWTEMAVSPLTRDDFDGLALQVGLFQATYNTEQGYAAFDDFSIEGPLVVPGLKAYNPSPADGATDVPRNAALAWASAAAAATYNVYFGENLDDVTAADETNPPGVLVSQGQSDLAYDPDGLFEFGQMHYWRVDLITAEGEIYPGDVWSFTAEPLAYPIKNITATSNTSSDAEFGPDKTVDGSGLSADDLHSTLNTDMWVGTPPAGELAYIQYDFDQVYKLCELQVWNYNVMFELMLGFGFKDVTIEYSENGADWTVLNDVVFAQGTAKGDYAANTTVDLEGVAAKSVRLTANSGHGMMGQFGLSEVRFLYTPVQAREAEPADGATDVSVDAVLDWRAGREAVSHEVYFGTDAEALALVDTVTDSQYNPGGLDLATTYYWQISEVNEAEAISTWQGPLWSFATQAYLVVDDFESYDDEDNVIYESWVDGWVNETGSTVGYLSAPFAEQTIVNSGKQSMPLSYDNTGGISVAEVELALTPAQNWTQAGVTTLVVSFRGDLDNDDAQVYVKINGTKVTGGGSTTMVLWKQWNIDLASTGANLQNVTSVTIGVEGSGSGVIYVDDLRLYAAAPAVATPVDPGADGLVAQYAFENNATDGTGNGYDGTPMNDPFYEDAAGDLGRAMMFDGINDYVDLPIGTLIGSLTDMSVATWVNLADSSSSYQRIFDFGSTDTGGYMFLAPREGTTGPIRFAITPAGGTESIVSTTMNLPSGWHHLAVVIDSASMTASVYLDGALAASGATATLPQDLGTPTQNWLGRSQYEADGYFTGSLADFSIYNRALSAGEVSYLAGAR
jgi:concanavalin A-like lectin/glucanase superfamily protein/F5/8 type C domain-containing protein